MTVDFKEYSRRMDKALEHLDEEFASVRAGRANAKVLDRITVEYYGSETPLNGVATISAPDARTLIIQPWDTKLLKDIQKAIQTSDLGINPQNDGRVIRLVFPQLTEERRKDLAKQVKKYSEEAKVAMRNIRRDGMDYVKKLKKNSEITEDDQKKAEKDLQDLLDKNIKRADAALAATNHLERGALWHFRKTLPRPGILPSSWTATAAGQSSGVCPAPPVTPQGRKPSGGSPTTAAPWAWNT